jgi:hypothetical protein
MLSNLLADKTCIKNFSQNVSNMSMTLNVPTANRCTSNMSSLNLILNSDRLTCQSPQDVYVAARGGGYEKLIICSKISTVTKKLI